MRCSDGNAKGEPLISKAEAKMALLTEKGMVGWVCDDVHRQEANYLQVVHVDYLDYD